MTRPSTAATWRHLTKPLLTQSGICWTEEENAGAPRCSCLSVKLWEKSEDFCLDFAIIPEVVHNGTLVVDDIEDSSEVRRGKPCTYKIFGIDIAVNAGNAMYYLPLLPLMEQKNRIPAEKLRDVYEVYVQEMINLSIGQAMDIAWHRGLANADGISEEDYLQMCAYKTGTLARMSAKIAAVIVRRRQRTW